MIITAFFTNKGTPATGLSPTIRIRELAGDSLVITDDAMSESGDGWYKYDFSTYDEDVDYVIRADGTATLSGSDRYVFSSNETGGVGNILKIEKGKWEIKGNQMLFYDDDGSTVLYRFNLQNKSGSGTELDVFKRVPTA